MEQQLMRVRSVGGVAVVGMGDHAAGDPLPDGGLAALAGAGRNIVIDLAANTFLTSVVLGRLIMGMQAVKRAGRTMRICCPPGQLREVFEVTKLDHIIPIFDTLADALAGL